MSATSSRSRAKAITAQRSHWLYRCYDAEGLLLYIGTTSNPEKRERMHRGGHGPRASQLLRDHMASFVLDTDAYTDSLAARRAEADAIRTEQPIFNMQERCINTSFIKGQIDDYLAGRPLRSWAGPIYGPARWRESA